jgi:hypothetical protein
MIRSDCTEATRKCKRALHVKWSLMTIGDFSIRDTYYQTLLFVQSEVLTI